MHEPPIEDHSSGFPAPATQPPTAALDGVAATPAQAHVQLPDLQAPPPRRAGRGRRRRDGSTSRSSTAQLLTWGLVALLAIGGAGAAVVALQGPSGSGPNDVQGGTDRDGAWSYYHDTDYDAGAGAAKWSTDRSRSSDADEAVLGDTTRWDYEGPYRYGPYGSDGMRRRARGTDGTDPLYSQPDPLQDVFTQYGGDLDPSGGQPVGSAPSSMTNPYYDPYAGYSNPYANRIRLGYGEGVGRGASYAP